MKPDQGVAIVGGGNAALCAAITAAEAGAKVVILESAPKTYRGGNSRHTRNFRCMHGGPMSVLTDSYGEDEYFEDLMLVTKNGLLPQSKHSQMGLTCWLSEGRSPQLRISPKPQPPLLVT